MTVHQGQVTFGGRGNLSPRTIQRQQIGARFAGAGNLSARFVVATITTAATTWPSTIPQCPILNGFSEQKQTNNVAFSPDVGPPKIRRRSTAAAWMTSVTYRMTTDELETFKGFYEDDLADGSLPFSWTHPIMQTSFYWMFDPKDSPKIDHVTATTWRVSFNLLRLP